MEPASEAASEVPSPHTHSDSTSTLRTRVPSQKLIAMSLLGNKTILLYSMGIH